MIERPKEQAVLWNRPALFSNSYLFWAEYIQKLPFFEICTLYIRINTYANYCYENIQDHNKKRVNVGFLADFEQFHGTLAVIFTVNYRRIWYFLRLFAIIGLFLV